MMTLYGTAGSGSAAVELALQHCGAPYRLQHASSWEADSAQAELRAVNPLAQIPTLRVDDGSVLTESAAILIHLGLAHPDSGLLPAAPAARDQAIRGLVFIAANCYAAIGVIDYPDRWTAAADAQTHEALRAGARARLHHCWTVFADEFTKGLSDIAPGALEYMAAVVSRWSGARAHLREQRPALHALLERIEKSPLAAPIFTRHWPG